MLGAQTVGEADAFIRDFIRGTANPALEGYTTQLNEFIGERNSLGFSSMSIEVRLLPYECCMSVCL